MIRLTDGERRDGGEEFEKTFFRLCSEYPESFGENDRAEMERAWRSTSGMTREELDDWTEIVGIAARGLYVSHLFTGEHMTSELSFRPYLDRLDAARLPLSGFSVSGAAKSLNISYPNFARLSRRVLEMPLKQYILKRKTAAAAEMISSGQIRTVRAAASAIGIDDPRYFSRLFIRHIGCSCSEYIRRHGKSREQGY